MTALGTSRLSSFRAIATLAALLLLLTFLVAAPRADAELPAAVKGQVLSEMDPLGYAKVTVFDATTGTRLRSGTADGEGYYLIGGLPAGPVKVRASKDGYLDSWASGKSSKATATVYTLLPGETLEQTWDADLVLYLDLAPESVVTGTIMGFSYGDAGYDDPVGGVKVTAFSATTGEALGSAVSEPAGTAGEWGTFRIGKLPAGQVKLRATAPGWLTTWAHDKWTKATADVFSVQPFSPTDIGTFAIYAPAGIAGAVMLDDEPVIEDVKVTVFDADTGKALRSVVDDDGYFQIDGLPPVRVKVRASGPFYTTAWANWLSPGTKATATVFTLVPGQVLGGPGSDSEGAYMNVSRAASIQGQVLGNFDPLGYAKVVVFDAATGTRLRSTTADGDGNYRIDKIPVGFAGRDVKVRASKDGWVSSWANGKTSKATADTFFLVGGQTLVQSWDPNVLYLDLSPLAPMS